MSNKVVIFDFDGTIVDSGTIAFNHWAKIFPDFTREVSQNILTGNFHDGLDQFMKERGYEGEKAEQLKQAHHPEYIKEKMKAPLFEGMRELLQELHSTGYTLALNTSARDRNLIPLLENFGIKDLFDLIASADFERSKVKKFQAIAENYKVSPKEMIFVTDTLGDLKDAAEINIPTIAVTWGAHDRSYFDTKQYKNLSSIVDTAAELSESIKKHFA